MDIKDLILNKTAGNLYWKDKNSIYLGCNANMAKVFKLNSPEEVVGKNDYDFYLEDKYVKEIIENDQLVIKEGKEIILEEIGADSEGRLAIYLTKKTPLRDNNNEIIGVIGTSIDITKEKQFEKNAIDATRSKTTFLSIASHEIKGPLSNNIYVLEKLEKTIQEDPSKTPALLQLIRDQLKDARRGVDTINYLLDFLNLDLTAEGLKEPRECPFAGRIVSVMDPYEEKYTNIEFSLNYDKQIPKIIFVPEGLIEIVEILIANAVKYSKKNAFITIKVSNVVKDSKTFLKISVEDNGIGINKSALDRFFAPLLFEGMKDGERIYSAPAIKLSYAKKFVESLGGEFSITSEPDVGTTVTMIVPYAKSESDYSKFIPRSFEHYETTKIAVPNRKLNFLIVEDNPLTLQILDDEISRLGHHVDAVPNAHEALKKAKDHDYEVAFLDISLPGMDGVELRHKLTKKGGDFPIVIAITSHDSDLDKDYFMEKGFTAVIGKPFTRDEIFDCIDTIQKVIEELRLEDEQKYNDDDL